MWHLLRRGWKGQAIADQVRAGYQRAHGLRQLASVKLCSLFIGWQAFPPVPGQDRSFLSEIEVLRSLSLMRSCGHAVILVMPDPRSLRPSASAGYP
jgi:hypothetical protein